MILYSSAGIPNFGSTFILITDMCEGNMLNRCMFGCHELCSFEFCVLHTDTNSAGWRCARCNLKKYLLGNDWEHCLLEQESVYMNHKLYVKLYQEKQLNSISMRPEMSQQV